MLPTTTPEALALIEAARSPRDVFIGDPDNPADRRAARRRLRSFAALVHPDRALTSGADAAACRDATLTLNPLYRAWTSPTRATGTATTNQPHVSGANGTYTLRTQLHATTEIATYGTDDPDTRVDLARNSASNAALDGAEHAISALAQQGMSAFGPHLVDAATTAGHRWIAYRIPTGIVPLQQIHAENPRGLDGRDWAWIARRIVMTLDAAGIAHGNLTPQTVFIHPEQHGVVLTGWSATPLTPRATDGPALHRLFTTMLNPTELRQLHFAESATQLSPAQWLDEYDLLLTALYGPRRFRRYLRASD